MSTRFSSASSEAQTAEPTASPAEIQSAGFVIALDQDWRIKHVSENIGDHFADFGGRMAGQPLADFFGASAVHALRNQLAILRGRGGYARLFSLFFAGVPKPFDVALHQAEGTILLEALPAAHLEVGDPVGTVRTLSAKLGRHTDLPALLADGAHQLRALTGFDRVILFRRSHDGIKQVAEDSRVSAPPAIPSRLEESLRIICDSAASSVTLDPPADAGLLKGCILCGCSADEREAAKGNGAAASLMVPIRSGEVLWGAALCLNRLPRRPMLDRLAAAELFAEVLAMRIEICELKGRGA
jgi:light-regulated signal transduction histidine kinase (bacteriophytochrome)